jgi:hypothetical protein
MPSGARSNTPRSRSRPGRRRAVRVRLSAALSVARARVAAGSRRTDVDQACRCRTRARSTRLMSWSRAARRTRRAPVRFRTCGTNGTPSRRTSPTDRSDHVRRPRRTAAPLGSRTKSSPTACGRRSITVLRGRAAGDRPRYGARGRRAARAARQLQIDGFGDLVQGMTCLSRAPRTFRSSPPRRARRRSAKGFCATCTSMRSSAPARSGTCGRRERVSSRRFARASPC